MFPWENRLKAQNALSGGAWCWLSTTPDHGGYRWLSELPTSTRRVLVGAGTREPRGDPWCLHEYERLVDNIDCPVLRIVSTPEVQWCVRLVARYAVSTVRGLSFLEDAWGS